MKKPQGKKVFNSALSDSEVPWTGSLSPFVAVDESGNGRDATLELGQTV